MLLPKYRTAIIVVHIAHLFKLKLGSRPLSTIVTYTKNKSLLTTRDREKLHVSLPLVHSTPEKRYTRVGKRAWSSKKNQNVAPPSVANTKKCTKLYEKKLYKSQNSNFNIVTQNRFEVLLSQEEENTSDDERPGKNKILLCADSHGRNLAWHLNNIHFLTEYEAVGFINPGGRSKQILKKKNIEGENLNKKDILVLMCGSNDIAGNEAEEALSNISDTLDNTKNTNVVLVDLPMRYDLVNWSCVNRAVSRTNLRLKELGQKYSHATVVDVSKAERHFHTRHGQHLNTRGKQWLAKLIAEKIQQITKSEAETVPATQQSGQQVEEDLSSSRSTASENCQPLQLGKHPDRTTATINP
ncbi:hypothetical protein J6590_045353 [Homalodisca vitripennis]|nr:hypothetical protein J6590_045353 [Homalodisca vitripennis]